jgi:sugar phosphate isomerase/epimerase
MPLERTVLWQGTLPPCSLSERISAAAATGYPVTSVSPTDYHEMMAQGVDPARIVAEGRERGVAVGVLDAVIEWYPHEPPRRPFASADFSVDDVLRMCEILGVASLSAVAPFPTDLPIEGLAEQFALLCDKASGIGCRVHFEFTPRSPISDVKGAWDLVRLADRPNGGIVFDTWHFFRVNPDFDALEEVPGDRIFAVQVSDGGTDFVEGLLADTFRHRSLPGEGVFDLRRVLRVLERIGGLRMAGPEVLSEQLHAFSPREAARRAAEAFDAVAAVLDGRPPS